MTEPTTSRSHDHPHDPGADPCPVAQVTIDEEQGVARLRIPGALDPTRLDVAALIRLARRNQVAINPTVESRIASAAEAFRARAETIECVIAERRDPVDGTDGRIEWMEGYEPSAGTTESGTADSGRVDHYSRVHYMQVAAGAHVATIHPPTPGEPGLDVGGRAIAPAPGKPCDVRVDRTLDVRAGRVLARDRGVLEFADRTLRVSRLLEVDGSVDFSTGNIDFDGTVVVQEGIQDHFAVRATESIVVHGLIQSARLECGGNLIAHCGIAGRERGRITVAGTLEAGYLDRARGTIAGDLVVAREIMHCRLDVGGELRAERAAVIGGDSTVRYSASIGRIGSPSEIETTLVVGRIALLGRVERLLARLLAQDVELVARHGEPPPLERDHCAGRAPRRLRGVDDRFRELRQRIAWCRDQQAALEAGRDAIAVGLEVGVVIHAGVRLLVGPHEVIVKTRLAGPLRIDWYQLDEPLLSTGGGHSCPLAHRAETHLRAA